MVGMAYMNDLNTANVLRQLWEKLPRHLRSKWTERVSKIRNTKERMADFSDFCQFVSEQADLATDPIYSEEMVSRSRIPMKNSGNHNIEDPGETKVRILARISRNQMVAGGTLAPAAALCVPKHMIWTSALSF